MSIDIYTIAEKVASVINTKISPRLDHLERRVRQLEIAVEQLHTSAIEAVVRSVLYVKMDEVARAIAVRVGGSLSSTVSQLQNAVERLGKLASSLETAARTLETTGHVVDKVGKIEDVLAKLESLTHSSSKERLEKLVSAIDELSTRVKELEEKVSTLAKNVDKIRSIANTLEKLASEVGGIEDILREVKEDSKYSRHVLRLIEERLRGGEGT